MNQQTLTAAVRALLAPGKGLLAADESLGTIGQRFAALGIASNPQTRRAYREMLVTAPESAGFLSGIILFDETLRDTTSDGTPFPQLLSARLNALNATGETLPWHLSFSFAHAPTARRAPAITARKWR